tara:strand:+ start:225 stop:848 length:624 start_codon:yes stop_codon:yes gene_type:complete
MPDYQKGKIYKLVSDHTDEIYIGSTIQKLCKRLSKHASDFRKGINACTSKKVFELGKVKIVLIENCPCDSKEELYKRERHYIETTDCVNKCIPFRSKEEKIQYKIKYNEDNKEELSKKNKEYCLKNKEEILKQKKEHYLKNKDKFKEKHKEYRLKNNDKIKERKKVRTICDCGLDINKDTIARHKRTKKHLNLMESKTHLPTPSNLE